MNTTPACPTPRSLAVATKITASLEGANKDDAFEALIMIAFVIAQRAGLDANQALAKITAAAAFAAAASLQPVA